MLLSAAASQFGLGNLPTEFKRAVQFVPTKVDGILRAAIAKVAGKAIHTATAGLPGLPAGSMAATPFSYGGRNLLLVAVQDTSGARAEVYERGNAAYTRVGTGLTTAAFANTITPNDKGGDGDTAKEHLTKFLKVANDLHKASKANPTTGTAINALKEAKTAYNGGATRVLADIAFNSCVAGLAPVPPAEEDRRLTT